MLLRQILQIGIGMVVILATARGSSIAQAASFSSPASASEETAEPSILEPSLEAGQHHSVPLSSTDSNLVAQFFPYANTNEQMVMVQGQGTASAAAEFAEMEFVLVNYDPFYDPYACYYDESGMLPSTIDLSRVEPCPAPPTPPPLTQTSFQSAIAALTNTGIPRNQIRLRLPSDPAPDNDFATLYYPDGASLLVTVPNPSRQQVQEMVTAVEAAVSESDALYLQDRYVQYTLSEAGCQTLEREAYRNAVAHAQNRASILAEALGVQIGEVPSVADSLFSFSALFGSGTPSSYCDADSATGSILGSFPSPAYYDPLAPAEVRSQRSVLVTYPVRR